MKIPKPNTIAVSTETGRSYSVPHFEINTKGSLHEQFTFNPVGAPKSNEINFWKKSSEDEKIGSSTFNVFETGRNF